ncbi:sensor histidine kinase [Micromonospora sp. NPDC000442]|uniref:sensor histidine kinase n=1 Tax=Micromonospora sp. NPDC000442 TaxID=3364217 RepID=UPI003689CC73
MARRLSLWMVCATGWWLGYGWIAARNYQQTTAEWGIYVPWSEVLTAELITAVLWIPLTVLALALAAQFPLGRPTPLALGVHLAGLAVAVLGRSWVVHRLDEWLGCWPALPLLAELAIDQRQEHAFTYALLIGVGHALHYAAAHRRREAELARAELARLRAQIRPHFLFNALNAIAAVVHEDPDRAERMVVNLGTLLRQALEHGDDRPVPLSAELELTRCYLDIEQQRYGGRLRVSWDVSPDVAEALVPPLVLQPLAENAVRHGLAPRAGGGRVRIVAHREGDTLRLAVEDDGVGPGARSGSGGIGLASVRSRLRAAYGARIELTAGVRPGGGFRVLLRVPWRSAGAQQVSASSTAGVR